MVLQKNTCVRYDTDAVARNIFPLLLRDFRTTEGNNFGVKAEEAYASGITPFRDYTFPEIGVIHPTRFKRWHQLANLLKKYRFKQDKFSDEELQSSTHKSFCENQIRLSIHQPRHFSTHLVIQEARKLARGILGSFDSEKTTISAHFGKKSSIGCPLSLAYIDHKLTDVRAFSGSTECSKWFLESYLPGDSLLTSIVSPILAENACDFEHDSLNLVDVPKSWKTLRRITPLTLLALFYSYGVGEQVTEKLKIAGLDITRLQNRHGKLIKRFSRRRHSTFHGGSHATADLSSASDSLTSELLNSILPREWYNACKKTFTHQVVHSSGTMYSSSVLPMGNGLTFPVETLIFYCLIKAIGNLLGTGGIYSVYGDDLIYPSRIHKYVCEVFSNLKLIINRDKTFVNAPFRESCGSDYYRGVDVRPCILPDGHHSLTRSQYLAWLHKTINGLRRRWDDLEIPQTLNFLFLELGYVSGTPLFRVPPSYPDTAGIKVDDPNQIPNPLQDWESIDCSFHNGSIWYRFSYLRAMPRERYVKDVRPYYWLALQGRDDSPVEFKNFWDNTGEYFDTPPQSELRWKAVSKTRFKSGTKWIVKKKYRVVCSARDSSISYATKLAKRDQISFWA